MATPDEKKSRVFSLQSDKPDTTLKQFWGAYVITPEPQTREYMTGAWNYWVRKTSNGFYEVDYPAAIAAMQSAHPDWIIVYPARAAPAVFGRNRHHLEDYTPPGE